MYIGSQEHFSLKKTLSSTAHSNLHLSQLHRDYLLRGCVLIRHFCPNLVNCCWKPDHTKSVMTFEISCYILSLYWLVCLLTLFWTHPDYLSSWTNSQQQEKENVGMCTFYIHWAKVFLIPLKIQYKFFLFSISGWIVGNLYLEHELWKSLSNHFYTVRMLKCS